MREFIVNKNDAGQRLDKFLGKAVKNLPSSLLYKSIRTKKIKVNRKRATIDQILNEGDSILLFISDEFFENSSTHVQLKLTPRLDIVYEDENILLVNKRPGMLTHPDDNEQSNTLIDHITTYLYQKRKVLRLLKKLFPNAKIHFLTPEENDIINRPGPRIYKSVEFFANL